MAPKQTSVLMRLALSAIFLSTISAVIASCNCPLQCMDQWCQNGNGNYVRVYCADIQAQNECEDGNKEVLKLVSSFDQNVNLYLEGQLLNKVITPFQASVLRTRYSQAIEADRPEGDCTASLMTNLVIGHTTNCYSPKLFTECHDNILLKIPGWLAGIKGHFVTLTNGDANLASIQPVVSDFTAAIDQRSTANTARVQCQAYNLTLDEIIHASGGGEASKTSFALSTALLIFTLFI
ncbi:hypothetical protein BC830DRAFT_1136969 [Chytriomyces sp. MP71]|nr:hypothetical protein BC830DRAFT_1136969 [Chytriomyces sp. MP71]